MKEEAQNFIMGRIVKFPIIITDQKATEITFGMLNQLSSYISGITTASTEKAVSEKAISTSFYNEINKYFYAKTENDWDTNIIPFFKEFLETLPNTSGRKPIFNSIKGTGKLNINLTIDGEVSVDSLIEGDLDNPTKIGEILSTDSLNGGIYQHSERVENKAFDATVTSQILFSPDYATAIGKFLFKVEEAFPPGTKFSVGYIGNEEYFLKEFELPQENQVVKTYQLGDGLIDKIEYIGSQNISNPIYIFKRSGNISEDGKLNCVIFFDKITEWV
jgi:hypothetical protein